MSTQLGIQWCPKFFFSFVDHCRIFTVLSAILYLGNVTYRRKSTGRDEGLDVGPPEVLSTLSDLLKVECCLYVPL